MVSSSLWGGVFRGKIVDRSGLPVPYATVYIHEKSTGVSADDKGEFSINLDRGTYICEVSSMGYKRERFTVEIDAGQLFKNIVLDEEVYRLNDVYFRGRGEDRAYSVMRKAIAKAPYYRALVQSYSSDVYMKGTMKVTKIPALLKLQAGKSRTKLVLNKLFVLESYSTIDYSKPNIYNEKVRAISSTIPSDINPGDMSAVLKSSIYDREYYGNLSPLAANALSYYKFKYEGVVNENGRIINKIRVIPSKGQSKLFSGHIYIADDLWCVTGLEFTSKETGLTLDIKISFNEVKPEAFIPTAYTINANIDILGVKAEGRYNSSITYNSILISNTVPKREVPTNPTNRQARRVALNTEREETKRVREPGAKKDLEIKRDTNIKRTIDTLARVRDTLFWQSVRTIPLRDDEIISYRVADSVKKEFKKLDTEDSLNRINRSTGNRIADKIFYETKFKVGKRLTMGYGGLSKVLGEYNFVDGYLIGQNFSLLYTRSPQLTFSLKPQLYYSTGRDKLLWSAEGAVNYSPIRGGQLSVSVGDYSTDINNTAPISRFLNSYSSFLTGYSPIKFMSEQWIKVSNSLELSTGLRLNAGVSYSHVKPLANRAERTLFGKTPLPNTIENIFEEQLQENRTYKYNISIVYTPENYYRVVQGRKRYTRSRYPTFVLSNTGAIPIGRGSVSDFGKVSLSISQWVKSGLYSDFQYSITGGLFYRDKRVNFNNFTHFRATDITITERGFTGDFLLTDAYRWSTNHSWLRLSATLNSEYLLLKRLSFLSSQLLYETLTLKSLYLGKNGIFYTELGYAFGMRELIRGGLFVGFTGLEHASTGFRIEIPILGEFYR